MLIEDSSIIGKRLTTLLSELPFIEVLGQATRSMEAVDMIIERMPDIVLLDINIPGNNAFNILTWLHDSYKHIKVVMLSNHAEPEYRKLALSSGADYFLDKLEEFEKLPGILAEISMLENHE